MGDMALEQRSKTGENWKWDVCVHPEMCGTQGSNVLHQ